MVTQWPDFRKLPDGGRWHRYLVAHLSFQQHTWSNIQAVLQSPKTLQVLKHTHHFLSLENASSFHNNDCFPQHAAALFFFCFLPKINHGIIYSLRTNQVLSDRKHHKRTMTMSIVLFQKAFNKTDLTVSRAFKFGQDHGYNFFSGAVCASMKKQPKPYIKDTSIKGATFQA